MKIDAECKAGELLKGMAQRGERETGGKPKRSHDVTVLSDLGIEKMQSSRWQREAAVPESVWLKHAETVRAYAKVAGCRLKIQNDAACVKIDAECKAGELLKGMAQRGERRPKGGNQSLSHDATSLPDFGINRTQSSRWQRESAVPESVWLKHAETIRAYAAAMLPGIPTP